MTKVSKEVQAVVNVQITSESLGKEFLSLMSAEQGIEKKSRQIATDLNFYFYQQAQSLQSNHNELWFDIDINVKAENRTPMIKTILALRNEVFLPAAEKKGITKGTAAKAWQRLKAYAKESITQDLRAIATDEAIDAALTIETVATETVANDNNVEKFKSYFQSRTSQMIKKAYVASQTTDSEDIEKIAALWANLFEDIKPNLNKVGVDVVAIIKECDAAQAKREGKK